jgi:hypothetical protein
LSTNDALARSLKAAFAKEYAHAGGSIPWRLKTSKLPAKSLRYARGALRSFLVTATPCTRKINESGSPAVF